MNDCWLLSTVCVNEYKTRGTLTMKTDHQHWIDKRNGKNCPLCDNMNDDSFRLKVATLDVATLYLDTNQAYPGYCLLVFHQHVTSLEMLPQDTYDVFMHDLMTSAKAVQQAFQPLHMNYASLGNYVPHLHFHIIPRYENDPRWSKYIWTTDPSDLAQQSLSKDEYAEYVERIQLALP